SAALVDHERASSCAPQHESGAEARRSPADDDRVPHVPVVVSCYTPYNSVRITTWHAFLRIWQGTDRERRVARARSAPARPAPVAGAHARAPLRAIRHLGEHDLAARIGQAPGEPRAAPAAHP